MREIFGARRYAQAREAQELISASIRETFAEVDILASPTVPMLPPRLEDGFGNVSTVVGNTGPFNVSGHPAISVKGGRIDGLPAAFSSWRSHTEERYYSKSLRVLKRSDCVHSVGKRPRQYASFGECSVRVSQLVFINPACRRESGS